jgi:hypothetical protein
MFIKLYESALFFKVLQCKITYKYKVFYETLEGTGQAEDYRLKLSPKKGANNTEYCKIKKPVNEFVKTHLLAMSLGFMSQTQLI